MRCCNRGRGSGRGKDRGGRRRRSSITVWIGISIRIRIGIVGRVDALAITVGRCHIEYQYLYQSLTLDLYDIKINE